VRPDPWGKTFSPVTRPIAEANVPCTVIASGCTCQPAKSDPSYDKTSLKLRMSFEPSPVPFHLTFFGLYKHLLTGVPAITKRR
jgi:hypothetical protein